GGVDARVCGHLGCVLRDEVGGALLHDRACVVEDQRPLAGTGGTAHATSPPLVIVEVLAVATQTIRIALIEHPRERRLRRWRCRNHRGPLPLTWLPAVCLPASAFRGPAERTEDRAP